MIERLNQVQKAAKKSGIMCEKPVWKPLHKNLPSNKCPNADHVFNHALSIPLYSSLTEEEVEYVIKELKVILTRANN